MAQPDIRLDIHTGPQFNLRMNSRQEQLNLGNAIPVPSKDYRWLDNLPAINERTIIGHQSVAYYLQDGLILDGGDASTAGEVTS